MRVFVGSISYYATGEGVHNWVYAANAEDEESFKARMAKDMNIDPYFMLGCEIDDPEILKKYEKEISVAAYGIFKYHLSFNMS